AGTGTVDVVVTGPGGTSTLSPLDHVTYVLIPPTEIPSTQFVLHSSASDTVRIRERWATAHTSAGVCEYDLEESQDGAAFRHVALDSATATSVGRTLSVSSSYAFRLQVVDCDGDRGAWGIQPFAASVSQEDDGAISYTGAWVRQADVGADGGALEATTSAN